VRTQPELAAHVTALLDEVETGGGARAPARSDADGVGAAPLAELNATAPPQARRSGKNSIGRPPSSQ
jgi:hypothetical protein